MKRFHIFLVVLLVIFSYVGAYTIKSEDNVYYVRDNNSGLLESFDSYSRAYSYYEDNIDNYDNLILQLNDDVLIMEYGIVKFNSDNACSINIEYRSDSKGETDYLNGCYGIDAAYLRTSKNQVYFVISGDTGHTSIDNVTLIPYEDLDVRISSYSVNDGVLTHNIKSQLDYDYYAYSLKLDEVDFLDNNKEYFSYDSHYFYDDFYSMIDDYRNNEHINSINEYPYYNYYQYLPHRSLTNYSTDELKNYFYEELGMNSRSIDYYDLDRDNASDKINRSQMYDNIDSFFIYQNMYGTNAMLLISSAIYESSYGKSLNSYDSNNLYLTSAYETEYEKENDTYTSIDESIYSHSKSFISSLYSNHRRNSYSGTFLGNKYSGINVNYSIDPYYGEKVVNQYYSLDKKLGYKDKDNYCIGIIQNKNRLSFYDDEELDYRKFYVNDVEELAFVVLDENDYSYKIQIDNSFDDNYLYDFEDCVAYISKDDVSILINEDKINEYDYDIAYFDLNGGLFHELDELYINVVSGTDLASFKPYKEGYEFIGFNDNVAEYKKIEKIELINSFNTTVELYQYLDLSGGLLRITYEDNTYKNISLNTDMIRNFDNSIEGNQTIIIDYCGVQIEKEIYVSKELYDLRNTISESLINEDYDLLKENISKLKYPLTFSQIRNSDMYLRNKNKRNYVLNDKTDKYDISISGLDLGLENRYSFIFVDDTYYVDINDIKNNDVNKITKVAKGYGFDKVEGIDISFRFNYQSIELNSPAIVQLNIKDKRNDLVYSVYHLDENDNVIKCRTTQSDNYIQFMINESGSYLVLSMPSSNEYHISDSIEDLSYENMGVDNHKINIEIFMVMVLALTGIIGITVYYIYYNKRKNLWKDYRRSLRKAGIVQEEKQKN